MKLIHIGHPLLRAQAEEVTKEELRLSETQRFIDDLIQVMRDAHGVGIAATQVGVLKKIFVVENEDNPRYPYEPHCPLTVVVNPSIKVLSKDTISVFDGCLSIPSLKGRVKRHAEIQVTGWDREGTTFSQQYAGITGATFQHEMDHLDGVLFLDKLEDPESLCTPENFKKYFEQEYVEYVGTIVERYGQ